MRLCLQDFHNARVKNVCVCRLAKGIIRRLHAQADSSDSHANVCVVLQLAEAEAELDAMTKGRDELQLVVEELEEKVTHHLNLPHSALVII